MLVTPDVSSERSTFPNKSDLFSLLANAQPLSDAFSERVYSDIPLSSFVFIVISYMRNKNLRLDFFAILFFLLTLKKYLYFLSK